MNELQKSKIRISHWIEHNVEHILGYKEVAQILRNNGNTEGAESILRAVELILKANSEFQKVHDGLPKADMETDQGHSHHHHNHSHDHVHDHKKHSHD